MNLQHKVLRIHGKFLTLEKKKEGKKGEEDQGGGRGDGN